MVRGNFPGREVSGYPSPGPVLFSGAGRLPGSKEMNLREEIQATSTIL